MAELQWVEMVLPSRGVLYKKDDGDSFIPDGKINIRKWLTHEIATLLSQGVQGLERVNKIIANCSQLPNGFRHKQLLVTDRMSILLAQRAHTFNTPDYRFEYKCPHCNANTSSEVDMTEFEESNPESIGWKLHERGDIDSPEDFVLEEPFKIPELPDAKGIEIKARFLRGEDEEKIATRSKRISLQSNDPTDPSFQYRLALMIEMINGEKEPLARREQFVREMTAADSARFMNAVDRIEPGIDVTTTAACRQCGGETSLPLPFTAEFFRPTDI